MRHVDQTRAAADRATAFGVGFHFGPAIVNRACLENAPVQGGQVIRAIARRFVPGEPVRCFLQLQARVARAFEDLAPALQHGEPFAIAECEDRRVVVQPLVPLCLLHSFSRRMSSSVSMMLRRGLPTCPVGLIRSRNVDQYSYRSRLVSTMPAWMYSGARPRRISSAMSVRRSSRRSTH